MKPAGIPPMAISLFFLLGYLVQASVVLPLFGNATLHLRRAWKTLMQLEGELGQAGASWQPGQAFQLNPAWLPLVAKVQTQGQNGLDAVGHGFLGYCVLFGIVIVIFAFASVINMTMLKRQVAEFMTSLLALQDSQSIIRVHQLRS
jgi:hypothetical protein